MADNLDNLLAAVITKTIFKQEDNGGEDGEIVKEDGEIDSGGEEDKTNRKSSTKHKKSDHKHRHKDHKHKNKSSDKIRSMKKSTNDKTKKKSSKHKKSKTDEKNDDKKFLAKDDNKQNEDNSEVMRLLMSKELRSYGDIEFRDEEFADESKDKNLEKSSSKHKSSKNKESSSKRHKRERFSDEYELQHDSYYTSRSDNQHEDYFYGSYWEGMDDRPRGSSKRYQSRPLSPLYESEWRHRSRSRSPFDYDRRDDRRRSLSPSTSRLSKSSRSDRRSCTPFFKDGYSRRKFETKERRRDSRREPSVAPEDVIDKQALLEVAKSNLIKMIESGTLPKGTDIKQLKLRHLRELTTQKSVQQYTEFCRAISQLESAIASDSECDSDYDDDTISVMSDKDHVFSIRHPFELKERKDISMRIRNFPQLPSRTAKVLAVELREQFPVSSGSQHRRKENELTWTEVTEPLAIMPPPKPVGKRVDTVLTQICKQQQQEKQQQKTLEEQPPAFTIVHQTDTTPIGPQMPSIPSTSSSLALIPIIASTSETQSTTIDSTTTDTTTSGAVTNITVNESETNKSESVFPQSVMPIDIGSVMAQRLAAMNKLKEDPQNVVALKQMYQANQMMNEWAESKIVPGQYIGSTGVNILKPDELNGPFDAWFRKDQFKRAAPITGGVGMHLLLKMGWTPGQGLGKNNEGVKDPIMLDIKTDKKGLMSDQETTRNLPLQLFGKDSFDKNSTNSAKNPISILQELCAKQRMSVPDYQLVADDGPPHRKCFTFKVVIKGVEYQPSVSCANKKQAKALAASVCLQSLGILPKNKT